MIVGLERMVGGGYKDECGLVRGLNGRADSELFLGFILDVPDEARLFHLLFRRIRNAIGDERHADFERIF